MSRNASQTQKTARKAASETDKIEDIRDKTIKEIPSYEGTKKSRAFQPPTRDEVQAYCSERKNGIDPDEWMDYYAQRNWYLSKGVKMSDWKAAVRTWERHAFDRGPNKSKRQYASERERGDWLKDKDFDKMLVDLSEEVVNRNGD